MTAWDWMAVKDWRVVAAWKAVKLAVCISTIANELIASYDDVAAVATDWMATADWEAAKAAD